MTYKETITLSCVICTKTFTTTRPNRKYCDNLCKYRPKAIYKRDGYYIRNRSVYNWRKRKQAAKEAEKQAKKEAEKQAREEQNPFLKGNPFIL